MSNLGSSIVSTFAPENGVEFNGGFDVTSVYYLPLGIDLGETSRTNYLNGYRSSHYDPKTVCDVLGNSSYPISHILYLFPLASTSHRTILNSGI